MRNYEIMFIVKATMESDQVKTTSEKLQSIITENNSKVIEFKELGEKKLAYKINNETNGYYFVMKVEATIEAINEFNRRTSIDENVIRTLVIKLDEE